MNVYIVEDKQLILSTCCNDARKHLSDLYKDKRYLSANEVDIKRIKQHETPNLLIENNLEYTSKGTSLYDYLENKVGIEIEVFEENEWSET